VSRISSGYTRFLKWAFPGFWFGGLAWFAFQDPAELIAPALLMVLGWIFFRSFLWDVADEVHDTGEALRVRFRDEEETIGFDQILDVTITKLSSPQRISLRLARPGRFGESIAFFPNANRLGPGISGGSAIAEMLAARVARARSDRA
jgi:hypothetical protein